MWFIRLNASNDTTIKSYVLNQTETLQKLGQFCLQRIVKAIQLPTGLDLLSEKKPVLKLVVNNEQ